MTNTRNGKRFTIIAIMLALLLAVAGAGGLAARDSGPHIGSVPPQVWEAFSDRFKSAEAFDPPQELGLSLKLTDLQDRDRDWRSLEGRVMLVNFWALWCPPCLKELPSLKAVQDKRAGADFGVAYISMDYPENAAQLTDVMKLRKVPAIDTLYIRDLASWESVKLKALPTTLILDRKGRIAYRLLGDIDWEGPEASAFLDAVAAR